MKRKTSDVPTRIYSYRCLPPVDEAERVENQYRLAHQFRNLLVEIERRLRERFDEIHRNNQHVSPFMLAYEEAQAAVDNAIDDLRAAKSGVADPDLTLHREHLSAVSELRSLSFHELRDAKTTYRDELVPVYEAARAKAAAERKQAQHDFIERGLRTATYDRIKDAVRQAVQSTRRQLHFERYEGTGSIGTQLIGGLTVSELYSCQDTRLRLGRPGATDNHPRSEVGACWSGADFKQGDYTEAWARAFQLPRNLRRHAVRTYVELRVGSNPDRTPIFAKFPVTFHRPLPKDSTIKWAYIVRKRIGRHFEWRFQLTIESEMFRTPHQAVGEGTCAVDLGWRRLFDDEQNQIGLRAGYVIDEHGKEREILVPEKLWRGMGKVADLAKIRDQNLDRMRDSLVAWINEHPLPEVLADRAKGLANWRAPRKLAGLADLWRDNRFPDDAPIFWALGEWAKQDRHLQSWQEHQRARLIAHRREVWRVIATELARTYAVIVIEDGKNQAGTMRLSDIDGWERPAPEDGDPSDGREQRRMSRLAAVGELRDAIV